MKPEQKIARSKLADDDGFRVATEALQLATKFPCSVPMIDALFEIVQREARRVEGKN